MNFVRRDPMYPDTPVTATTVTGYPLVTLKAESIENLYDNRVRRKEQAGLIRAFEQRIGMVV
jgi:hypothetical protein